MDASQLSTLYTQLVPTYAKDSDQDFPVNKIRFFVDFLWNSLTNQPLTDTQRDSLKQLIDLLNSLDDHKLSTSREMIHALTPQLSPLLTTYPSLGHSFSVIFTTIIPAYQRYLSSLEIQVKDSHAFSKEEVLLYYDMTLMDHLVLSHVFEQEDSLNLIEVIVGIKTLIVINAVTHDYLQDAYNRSISLFTFMQRGGMPKEQGIHFYADIVDSLLGHLKETVTSAQIIATVEHLAQVLRQLAITASTAAASQPPTDPQPSTVPDLSDSVTQPLDQPLDATQTVDAAIPAMPTVAEDPTTGSSTPQAN